METLFSVPQGQYNLQRVPLRNNEKLRAWDAADEYVLNHLYENQLILPSNKVLILNDSFGALAVALHAYNPIAISDSWLSQRATLANLAANELSEKSVYLAQSLAWPDQVVDVVLIKIPKTLGLLEDQLIRLQVLVTDKTTIIAAGMVKTMSPSAWKLMARYLGATKPSIAKKKARLIFVTSNKSREIFKNPYPTYYQLENSNYRICNHANVFSRESLDIGTRFLLKYLPSKADAKNIVDLGCGNGVVGLMLAEYYPDATLHFVDESYMAIASAKENFAQAFYFRTAEFFVADGLTEFASESMDLIVCNPPFHQQHSIGNQLAVSMFKHSYRVLRGGGSLWVIGNRHLGYHLDLKRQFNRCTQIASNTKFVIWQAKK